MLDLENIVPPTVWRWAIGSAGEAEPLLLEATTALARLTASIGTIGELQAIYRWPDGRFVLEKP